MDPKKCDEMMAMLQQMMVMLQEMKGEDTAESGRMMTEGPAPAPGQVVG